MEYNENMTAEELIHSPIFIENTCKDWVLETKDLINSYRKDKKATDKERYQASIFITKNCCFLYQLCESASEKTEYLNEVEEFAEKNYYVFNKIIEQYEKEHGIEA